MDFEGTTLTFYYVVTPLFQNVRESFDLYLVGIGPLRLGSINKFFLLLYVSVFLNIFLQVEVRIIGF